MDPRRLARQSAPPEAASGPPYPSTNAALGGLPTIALDVPITAVFMFLYLCGAASHMTIFQVNRRRGHKFLMSAAMFGFCMTRTVTCIMRIVWATRPTNVSIGIAASIFVAAGVVLLFVINLVFAQRILRATHPKHGWHPLVDLSFTLLYALIVASLIILISFTVLTFYTLDPYKRQVARDLQLYGGTLFAVVAFLPIPMVLLGIILPRKSRVEKFGSGRFRTKVSILLTAAFLLSLGAWFRISTSYLTPRPGNNPAWYQSKACFYVFDFGVEIVVILLYVLVRVDRRFYIPNGSKGPGDYLGLGLKAEVNGDIEKTEEEGRTVTRLMSEEEVFDDVPAEEVESTGTSPSKVHSDSVARDLESTLRN
ncbi:hypothetical protein MMC13_008365 [Lambiella insularis]|nr:hypothetical protein [Lambiella insularis]